LIQTASDKYKNDNGVYPTSIDALKEANLLKSGDTIDSPDNPLKFTGRGKTKPLITSSGRDGEFGTEDDLLSRKDNAE
jgi:hypothetical protein